MIKLYQFPISHYCEKVRWTLDYKGVDYEVENLLPGLHIKKTKKIAPRSSVPVLVHDGNVVQNSSQIITYLDEQFPEPNLTPAGVTEKAEALEWEAFVDKEVGVHVRRCCYHILLNHPEIVIPFFTHGGPWYGKLFMKMAFPKLQARMRKLMDINDETAAASKEHLNAAVDKLYARYQQHDYLVGDQFSRADIAAASLLAPICMPDKYGLEWPGDIPEPMQVLVREFQDRTGWVLGIYSKHR